MLLVALAALGAWIRIGSILPGLLGSLLGLAAWNWMAAPWWVIPATAALATELTAARFARRGQAGRGSLWGMVSLGVVGVLACIWAGSGWSVLGLGAGSYAVAWLLVSRPGTPMIDGWTLANTVCGYGVFAAMCLLIVPLAPLALIFDRRHHLITRLLRIGMQMVYAATPTCGWRAEGDFAAAENARVLVANHESTLDILSSCTLPGPARVMLAKPWVFKMPVLGWAARAGGMLCTADLDTDDLAGMAGRIGGGALFVFPEGTRTRTGDTLRFRRGGFALARALNCPVVPVVNAGGRAGILPDAGWIRPTQLVSRILPPRMVPAEGTLGDVAEACRRDIEAQRIQIVCRLVLDGDLDRHLALYRVGFPPGVRRNMQAEWHHGAWRTVVAAIAAATHHLDRGPWLMVDPGWGTLDAALRVVLPGASQIAVETDGERRRLARAGWFDPRRDVLAEDLPEDLPPLAGLVVMSSLPADVTPRLIDRIRPTTMVVVAADLAPWWAKQLHRQASTSGHGLVVLMAQT